MAIPNPNPNIADGIKSDNKTYSSNKIESLIKTATELPIPEAGDAGKVLTVNDELEFDLETAPGDRLPETALADAGKVVTVNAAGDAYELDSLPDLTVYQTKEDNSLQTTADTVVGAINEVNTAITQRTPKFIGSLIRTSDSTTGKVIISYADLNITTKPTAVIGVQEYNSPVSVNIYYSFDETNSTDGLVLYFINTTNATIEKNRLLRFGLVVFEHGDVID